MSSAPPSSVTPSGEGSLWTTQAAVDVKLPVDLSGTAKPIDRATLVAAADAARARVKQLSGKLPPELLEAVF